MKSKAPSDPFAYDVDTPLSEKQLEPRVEQFMARVGARIAELRQVQGLSQRQVCEEHSINAGQLSRIENGKQNLTLRTACRIAAALGVRPWDFYLPREVSGLRLKKRKRTPPVPTDKQLADAAQQFRGQVGARIRELRVLQGMTYMSLEEFAGIPELALRRIEKGRVNFRASTAIRIADAIGVRPYEIYIPNEQSGIRLKSNGPDPDA